MKYVLVAPVGDNIDTLYLGVREFQIERIVLITPVELMTQSKVIKKDLEKFKIPVDIREIEKNGWEDMFSELSQIKEIYVGKEILIQVSTGDRDTQCAATSAAFVNGFKAFSVVDDEIMLLPVLKFSYYKLLTDRKLKILNSLRNKKECCSSLEELSKKISMSLPLISYHVNGTLKSEGLKQLGLVEVMNKKGKVDISLTTLGKMLVKGHV
jgi:DNA-binding transcriptional ArsR family regulator